VRDDEVVHRGNDGVAICKLQPLHWHIATENVAVIGAGEIRALSRRPTQQPATE